MVLVIDTSDGVTIFLALVDRHGRRIVSRRLQAHYRQSQRILPAIESLRHRRQLPLSKLTGVIVAAGPGPFTALRVGVMTANAVAWTLGLPLAAVRKPIGTNTARLIERGLATLKHVRVPAIVEPYYGRAPNVMIVV